MIAASKGTLSLRATDDVEGGLFDDFKGEILSARYAMYDYPNKEGKPGTEDGQKVLVAKIDINNPDAEKPITQYYSVGVKGGFEPNPKDGGRTAVSDGTESRGISKQSNFATFRNELISIGFPVEGITDDLGYFDGLVAHWNQKAQPKRANARPDAKEKKLLLPTKIYDLPGTGTGAGGGTKVKAKAAAGTKAKAAADAGGSAASDDDKQKAIATVVDLLAAKKSIALNKIKMDCFRAHMKDTPTRNAVCGIVDPDKGGLEFFVEGEADGLWKFDGETLAAA